MQQDEELGIQVVGFVLQGFILNIHPCQLWFENGTQLVLSEVSCSGICGFLGTEVDGKYLVNCPIPAKDGKRTPTAVSLAEGSCDTATVLLKVIYNKLEPKKKFAVCEEGLDLSDELPVRLDEWVAKDVALSVFRCILQENFPEIPT